MAEPHKRPTSAWPLALVIVALVIYASLYPFSGWRDQGLSPFTFLTAALPHYWTVFDVSVNWLGYMPLGFLLAWSIAHTPCARWATVLATLAGALLSLTLETLQSYLPLRVPSNLDLLLNSAGACSGAGCAWALARLGVMGRWEQLRARWLVLNARGAVALLALWPVALLFPAGVPLGLGQVFERLELRLAQWLADTPFLDWLPVRDVELQPLIPATHLVCVALGLLVPCLLGFSVLRTKVQRAVFALGTLAVGVGVTGLSAALSYGPAAAWEWLELPSQIGLALGLVLALLLVFVPGRMAAALALLGLAVNLALLNQASENAYFSETLHVWEQGQFIRFNGLAQWLGWLWPYATLAYLLARIADTETQNSN